MKTEATETKTHRSKQTDKIKVSDEGVIITWLETVLTEKYNVADKQLISEDKNKIKHIHDGNFLPHKDFLDAMKMLRKPVIDICELGKYDQFDRIRIYGVSFSGEQDEAKVVITYGKEVEWSGQVWISNTPLTPLYDQDKFTGSKNLDKCCAAILKEAQLYMDGKHAENPQLSLSFENGEKVELPVKTGEPA